MSARGLVSLLVMILTSVGGRARRGPSRRSAAKACGVAHPVTLVVGVRGETPDRNAVEDGKAVALPRRPEHRPKAGTGRDGRSIPFHFSLLVCTAAPYDTKKAGPQGPADIRS